MEKEMIKLVERINIEKAAAMKEIGQARIKKINKDYHFYNGMSAAFSICINIIKANGGCNG